jgi:hypothetical protein
MRMIWAVTMAVLALSGFVWALRRACRPVRNSYRRLDVVSVPLAHLAVADRHGQVLAMLPCRNDGQASSSGRALVAVL